MEKEQYKDQLNELTRKVAEAMRCDKRNVIIAFEGMDAAGKGGAIKRIVKKLDPREYEIHTIAAPERYELRRPYLWRFWNRLNDSGKITILIELGMGVSWWSVLKVLHPQWRGNVPMMKSIGLNRI